MKTKLDNLKLINYIEKSSLFSHNKIYGKKILIAYSGGQDSSSLLAIFYILSKKWNFELGVVYCNHCWQDSKTNSFAILNMLKKLRLSSYFVEPLNREPVKPEQKARSWRYSCFYEIFQHGRYDFILTGHNLSDSVETSLFHLCRGSGLKGFFSLKEYQIFEMSKIKEEFIFYHKPSLSFQFSKKKNTKGFYDIKDELFSTFCSYTEAIMAPSLPLGWNKLLWLKREPFLQLMQSPEQKPQNRVFLFLNQLKAGQGLLRKEVALKKGGVGCLEKAETWLKIKKGKDPFPSSIICFDPLLLNFKIKKRTFFSAWLLQSFVFLKSKTGSKALQRQVVVSFLPIIKNDPFKSSFLAKKLTILKKKGDLAFFSNPQIQKLAKKKSNEKMAILTNSSFVTQPWLQKPHLNFIYQSQSENRFDNSFLQFKKEFYLIRPLIKMDRETLFLFSKQLNLPIYYDQSNQDLTLTRNYIRKIIIPLLKTINPRFEKNIHKFSKILEFYYDKVGHIECPQENFDIFDF